MQHPLLRGRAFATLLAVFMTTFLHMANADTAPPRLSVAPPPAGVAANPDYTVRVRAPGGEWQDVFAYRVLVVKEFRGNDRGHDDHVASAASVALFDFRGKVEIEVQVAYTIPKTVTVRPASRNVSAQIANGSVRFALDKPAKLVIAVNGDKARELHLFASAPDDSAPTRGTTGVTYFGPGLHELDPFEYKVKSNETVYLAPGAVVRGQFTLDHVNNSAIRGRGVIDHVNRFTPGGRKPSNGIRMDFCRDITIEGVTILDSVGYHIGLGACENVSISNTNSFSVSQWADGIDAMSCTRLNIKNVFIRSSDDAIALYAGRWMFSGNSTEITVSDSIFWADVAHPIFVGVHGTPGKNEVISDVRFSKIDILEHHQPGPGYQGCLAINSGDGVTVRNVTFEHIRIEPITLGQLVNVQVFMNGAYNTEPGRAVENIVFRDVRYSGTDRPKSEIHGFDAERKVKNVLFDHVVIGDQIVTDAASMNLEVGPFVENIKFHGSASPTR